MRRVKDARSTSFTLPWDGVHDEPLDAAAHRIARDCGIAAAVAFVQVAAISEGSSHPGQAQISVAYLVLTREPRSMPADGTWSALSELPHVPARHARVIAVAVEKLRQMAMAYPLAVSLLEEPFTLGAVQSMYELLLGRPVHKASFRRTLQGSELVTPTGAWQTDQRGRPAQLYRRSNGGEGALTERAPVK